MKYPSVHGDAFVNAWRDVTRHQSRLAATPTLQLFANDTTRFERLSTSHNGMLIDHSKQHLDPLALSALIDLAHAAKLPAAIDQLFSGAAVNFTEQRAVQHMALRQQTNDVIAIDRKNVTPDVQAVRARIAATAEAIRKGVWRGSTGKRIRRVINIGIGGSDLGPRMVVTALQHLRGKTTPMVKFVANVDPSDLAQALQGANAEATLFIVTSKTFTTQETLANATAAREWLRAQLGKKADISKHFLAVSAFPKRAVEFGIAQANVFPMWDWVGGRYSLWSAVGLPIAISIGASGFNALLAGAADMDAHFVRAPLAQNLPTLHALIGIWNTNFEGHSNQLIIPYSEALTRLPAYLQQLEMESNGKRVDREGKLIHYPTCPALWGEPGTNGQHAFFQWIHQGTLIAPVDFIVAVRNAHGPESQHHMLLANVLAQSRALLTGREDADAHRASPGNRPSSVIVLPELNAFTLGQLIALYEHKVFVQGVIWGINSFDQFGVELGKAIANQLLPAVAESKSVPGLDGSTLGLLAAFRQ